MRVRSTRVLAELRWRHTFPLALSPVNQIVTPFCLSSVARSSAFTEPADPPRDRGQVRGLCTASATRNTEGGSPTWNVMLVDIVDEFYTDREREKGAWRGLRGWRAACAMMVCGQGVYVRSAHVMACTAPRAFSRVASNREEANTRLGSVDD